MPPQPQYAIIPRPRQLQPLAGQFELQPETMIYADAANQANATYLRTLLRPATGYPFPLATGSQAPPGSIELRLCEPTAQFGTETGLGPEGYQLEVSLQGVRLQALTPAGVFYGLQSLRQLLPVEIEQHSRQNGLRWRLPAVQIRDWPRFPWRGFMLDEGRHFHGKETVRQVLNWMALHKLNIFHWHLTEDQGWRIEIRAYPRLTTIGAWRAGTARSFRDMLLKRHDGQKHGGFYTQAEIREIVAYATERHITIVPEIDLPGHMRAALAAYPELGCNGGPFEVATGFGIHQDILCAGKQASLTFIQDVLAEVLELFPGPHIHIGGDEAPKARWKRCPDCQARMQALKLESEEALQLDLTNRVAAFLGNQGRRLVGWNQIVQPGLDPQAVAQYWIGDQAGLLAALRAGLQVVNSAYLETYLDHGYNLTPLQRAYRFDPVFPQLAAEHGAHILGLEAPLWTEWVPDRARLDYQTFPRLSAYAETGWSAAEDKDYADFRIRLEPMLERLRILGVAYAPEAHWDPPWYRRLFGPLTIAQVQHRTAG